MRANRPAILALIFLLVTALPVRCEDGSEDWWSDPWGTIGDWFYENVYEPVSEWWYWNVQRPIEDWWDTLGNTVSEAWNWFTDTVSGAGEAISETVNNAIQLSIPFLGFLELKHRLSRKKAKSEVENFQFPFWDFWS